MYRDAATRQVSDSTMTPLTPVKSKPRKVGVGSGKIRKVRVSATHGHKQRSQLSSRASTDKTRKTPLAPKQLNFDSLMSAVDFLADLPPKNQPVEQAPECTQEVENSTWQEIDYLPYIATTVPAMSTSTTMAILSNPSSETSETSEASPVTIMPWEQRYPPILCSRKRNFDDIMDHLQKQLSPENTMYYEYIYITSRKRDVQYTLQMRDYKEKPIIWFHNVFFLSVVFFLCEFIFSEFVFIFSFSLGISRLRTFWKRLQQRIHPTTIRCQCTRLWFMLPTRTTCPLVKIWAMGNLTIL
jgi:hypothetical protein